MVEVTLSSHNVFWAGLVGVSRHVKGINKAGQFGASNPESGWQYNCTGACGEMAVSKWLGVFWDGALGDFRAKDAGRLQVRTNHRSDGDLILHQKDHDDDVFVLVLAHQAPTFYLVGWLTGREGKSFGEWRDGAKGRPAFFINQSLLHTMASCPIQPIQLQPQ